MNVDWANRIVYVYKSDMIQVQSVPTEIWNLDIESFRANLHLAQESKDGIPFPSIFSHNTEVQLGGILLARVLEIINNYTITFEDGQYAVNLINANSNIGDRVNVNQVSVRSSNSAGLVSSGESGGTCNINQSELANLILNSLTDNANPNSLLNLLISAVEDCTGVTMSEEQLATVSTAIGNELKPNINDIPKKVWEYPLSI